MKTAKAKPKRTAVQMGILFTAIFFIGIGIAKQEYLEVSACVSRAGKWLCGRLSKRYYFYREKQGDLCSCTKLLFVSRCFGRLSNWFSPGGDWRQKASFSFLCIGDADAVWNCAGAAGLRFAVPVWSGTGFAVSDSNTESASTQKD